LVKHDHIALDDPRPKRGYAAGVADSAAWADKYLGNVREELEDNDGYGKVRRPSAASRPPRSRLVMTA
jgi:hypothetical protein